jgi:hypothetical protein
MRKWVMRVMWCERHKSRIWEHASWRAHHARNCVNQTIWVPFNYSNSQEFDFHHTYCLLPIAYTGDSSVHKDSGHSKNNKQTWSNHLFATPPYEFQLFGLFLLVLELWMHRAYWCQHKNQKISTSFLFRKLNAWSYCTIQVHTSNQFGFSIHTLK